MFSDLRRSTQYLIEYNKQFMFNEVGGEEEEGGSKTGGGEMQE